MAEWWESGQLLREKWLLAARKANELITKAFETIDKSTLCEADAFITALLTHARGDSTLLNAYLRSDQPFSSWHRELLAQAQEGQIEKKLGRPRELDDEHRVAMQASAFYRSWRQENKQRGIKDHGKGNEMKDEAVRFVIEELESATIVT